ncbi:MAG TPA: hypothetical protein VGE22_08520 [Solimonas sp.]
MLNRELTQPRAGRAVRQSGVVLFIALIVLVLMTLAGIALLRSTLTGNMVAGNLAFQQSATASADVGVETAIAWLQGNATGGTLFTSKTTGATRYSAVRSDPAANQSWEAYWPSLVSSGLVNTLAADGAGNTVAYVIQRLCTVPGVPSAGNCETSPAVTSADTGSKGSGAIRLTSSTEFYYRITVRVIGPRNTVSFVQTVVAM